MGLDAPLEIWWRSRYPEPDDVCGPVRFEFRAHADGYGEVSAGKTEFPYCGGGGMQVRKAATPDHLGGMAVFVSASMSGFPWEVGSIPLRPVVARLLNDRGVTRHRKKRFDLSAVDLAEALSLDPSYGQAAFNLACAQARLGQTAGANASLARAVALDQRRFSNKACVDPDLESVRLTPGFKQLVSCLVSSP